jgi:ABC-type sugar transport system ATPase subunit
MVGRERADNYYREDAQTGGDREAAPVLRAKGLSIEGQLAPTDIEVLPGEVLGIGGLQGSGRSLLGQALAGLVPVDSGTVSIDGSTPAAPRFRDLIDRGLAWVPGDRQNDGMISDATVLSNFQLASLHDRFARFGLWRSKAVKSAADDWITRLDIRPPRRDARAGALSGGNQQKVVLAKWLCRDPRAVILENPTQGVDTGARESIYEVIRGLTADGVGVVLITDDLTELIGLSDRIAVMVGGQLTASFEAPAESKPDEKEVVALMSSNRVEVHQ